MAQGHLPGGTETGDMAQGHLPGGTGVGDTAHGHLSGIETGDTAQGHLPGTGTGGTAQGHLSEIGPWGHGTGPPPWDRDTRHGATSPGEGDTAQSHSPGQGDSARSARAATTRTPEGFGWFGFSVSASALRLIFASSGQASVAALVVN